MSISDWWRAVRRSARALSRSPGFVAATTLSLGIGLGVCIAVFSAARATWFAPPTYPDPERLVEIWSTSTPESTQHIDAVPSERFEAWRARQFRSFGDLGGRTSVTLVLRSDLDPSDDLMVDADVVTGRYFNVLGTQPLFGRVIDPADDEPASRRGIVLSEVLWRERFGADDDVLGRTLMLSGKSHVVIGVMPERFEQGRRVWIASGPWFEGPLSGPWFPVARLHPGVSRSDATLEMRQVAVAEHLEDPTSAGGMGVVAIPVGTVARAAGGTAFWALAGVAIAVSLLMLTNLSTLFTLRAMRSRRSFAVRTALGASRRRLVADSVLEASLLSVVGFAIALWCASFAQSVMRATVGDRLSIPRGSLAEGPVLMFAVGMTLLVTLVASVDSFRRTAADSVGQALRSDGDATSTEGVGGRDSRRTVLTLQLALMVLLLTIGGVFGLAHHELARIDLGYQPENLSVVVTDYVRHAITDEEQWAMAASALERLRAQAGIEAASAWRMVGEDYPSRPEHGAVFEGGSTEFHVRRGLYRYYDVTPRFFETLGIQRVSGRLFGPEDGAGAPAVGIVTRGGAEAWWPGLDPIGRRLKLGEAGVWITVVGVVEDVADLHEYARAFSVGTVTRGHDHLPLLFRPVAQSFGTPVGWSAGRATVGQDGVVLGARARNGAPDPADVMVRALRDVDEELVFRHAGPLMEWQLGTESARTLRASRSLLAAVALGGFILVVLGILGMVGDSVARRVREIGIRKALGGTSGEVRRHLLRESLTVTVSAGVIGVGLVVALDRVVSRSFGWYVDSYLVGIHFTDPRVLPGAASLTMLISVTVAWIAARAVVAIEPAKALRRD